MIKDNINKSPDDLGHSFGFRSVDIDDKQSLVNQVFSNVANRYDLMNDLMTGGLHRLWKQDVITWLSPPKGDQSYKLLDVAGGTGDITFEFFKASGRHSQAVVFDISAEMLEVGQSRADKKGLGSRVKFIEGNAEELPFSDGAFDAYTIAFGIRNVPRYTQALKEAYRVLKPGGRFLCLEFSEVQVPVLDKLYDFYSFNAIPALGQLAAGDKESYQYLVESIRKFPDQDRFAHDIEEAGFSQVKFRNLSGGIAAIHSGWRI